MNDKRFVEDLDNKRFRFKELANTTIRIWDTLTNQQYFVNGMTPDSGWKFCTMFMYFFLETDKLRKKNEELISTKCTDCEFINLQTRKIDSLEKENEQLRQQIEQLNLSIDDLTNHTNCDDLRKENEKLQKKLEHSHFLNELNEIYEKDDLSDYNPLKEDKPLNDYNPLKNNLYYWQCKYYKKDYEHRMDMCTRCNYDGLLNYCLKDKCDKMVKNDYEVTIDDFDYGVSIGLKKRGINDEKK